MKVLLTGASGFVGSYVGRQQKCAPLHGPREEPVDLCDYEAVSAAVAAIAPDTVIHLASQSFVPESFQDPRLTFEINFLGTFNLLQALKASDFRGRMLHVGSGDTYGLVNPENLPLMEGQPQKPRNPYAVSKVAAEALCYQWSQTESFEIVMVRPFNHIGPGQSERFVVSDFARQVVEIKRGKKTPVIEVGDIDVTRDFTDVRDVVRAYELLLERGVNGEVYNVCSGRERSIREILEALIRLAGVEARIVQDPNRLRRAEQRRVAGSYAKLKAATGWQPEISFEQSLQDILTDWENKLL